MTQPVVADAPLTLALCGGLQIHIGGHDVVGRLPGRQGRALVAYLVLNRDRAVSRDELLDILWPADAPTPPPPRESAPPVPSAGSQSSPGR
jgi:hypothetical protein